MGDSDDLDCTPLIFLTTVIQESFGIIKVSVPLENSFSVNPTRYTEYCIRTYCSTLNVRNSAQGAYEIKQKSKLICVRISTPGGYSSRGVNLQMSF